jgi:CRISPR/Cas system CSM-associated protein Csm2 small subunit
MQKDLYMKNPNEKIVVQSDDLKYDGKNIIIPSYYAGVISDYLANVDTQGMNDADQHDFMAFSSFFEAILDYKNNK